MNRAEHLKWAKERALEYVQAGDTNQAFSSMLSDLGKHPDLKSAQETCATLGLMMLTNGLLSDPAQMTDFIEGFN